MSGKIRLWNPLTWHLHKCVTESDETGVWGECIVCHARFGFVDRKTLRRYIEAEIARQMTLKEPHDNSPA